MSALASAFLSPSDPHHLPQGPLIRTPSLCFSTREPPALGTLRVDEIEGRANGDRGHRNDPLSLNHLRAEFGSAARAAISRWSRSARSLLNWKVSRGGRPDRVQSEIRGGSDCLTKRRDTYARATWRRMRGFAGRRLPAETGSPARRPLNVVRWPPPDPQRSRHFALCCYHGTDEYGVDHNPRSRPRHVILQRTAFLSLPPPVREIGQAPDSSSLFESGAIIGETSLRPPTACRSTAEEQVVGVPASARLCAYPSASSYDTAHGQTGPASP